MTKRRACRYRVNIYNLSPVGKFGYIADSTHLTQTGLIEHLIKVVPGFLTTPGDGMSMWPPLFPRHTTTDQCWSEVHRPEINEMSVYRWNGMPKFCKKLKYQEILSYHVSHEKGCLRKEVCFGFNIRGKAPSTDFGQIKQRMRHNLGSGQCCQRQDSPGSLIYHSNIIAGHTLGGDNCYAAEIIRYFYCNIHKVNIRTQNNSMKIYFTINLC